jgi:hypothetical protein
MNKPDPKKPTLLKPSLAGGGAGKKKVQFGADSKTGGSVAAPPRPKALEYQPPIEYFKAMEAPRQSTAFADLSKF